MKKILQDLSYAELEALVLELGEKKFRAKQLYEGLMQGKTILGITSLSKPFKERLLEEYENEPVRIKETYQSSDGTEKYLFEYADGNLVEGVLMKYKYGYTQCVSTQVGCRMGCKFCASTLQGLIRNLTAGEILAQILLVNRLIGGDLKNRKITNIVLMGSGEPLDNYDNVIKFLKLVSAQSGINISQRNISLSTCGLVDKISMLEKEDLGITLTISLHAPTDEMRKQTMPIANRYSISEIIKSVRSYFNKTHRRIVFEYALINNQNDSFECAEILAELLKGLSCHVNLIPLNEVKERGLVGTGKKRAYAFMDKLNSLGISATVRRTMGEDIEGACGQLRAKIIKEEK